jgi:glycosyltransferase involved in cell wall biosynthesis
MKLAVVVQRYGAEIAGGSEYLCRLIAEQLAGRHEVEVLTTCARDASTWRNRYPEGDDRIRGVTVRRFANERTRDPAAFDEYSDWLRRHDHSPDDEAEWLKQQGPWCPGLQAHLEQHHRDYDALVFFDCLYAPTVLGLRVDPARSILVPAALDRPAMRLDLYREVFSRPAGIAYTTAVERGFLKRRFSIGARVEETVGCGVDLPPSRLHEKAASEPSASPLSTRGAVFRRRHRLHGPIALHDGRIEAGKGCEELLDYFGGYAESDGDLSLVLMGLKLMPIPSAMHLRFAGLLSEAERSEALEAATVVVAPSPAESLSLLALESFAVGTPVLANARSDVLVDHCQRSNAGLYYADRDEFVECLRVLVDNDEVRRTMGRNGRDYVRKNYAWDVVLGKYERLIAAVGGRTTGAGPRSKGRAASRGRGASRARRPPGSRRR